MTVEVAIVLTAVVVLASAVAGYLAGRVVGRVLLALRTRRAGRAADVEINKLLAEFNSHLQWRQARGPATRARLDELIADTLASRPDGTEDGPTNRGSR